MGHMSTTESRTSQNDHTRAAILWWHGLNTKHCFERTVPLLRMASSGMLRRVSIVITDVSEELSASFIRVTRIGELGTTLAVTSNQRTLYFFAACVDC
jgi:hypothetical protein